MKVARKSFLLFFPERRLSMECCWSSREKQYHYNSPLGSRWTIKTLLAEGPMCCLRCIAMVDYLEMLGTDHNVKKCFAAIAMQGLVVAIYAPLTH
jgi:hypothetical protein